VILKPKVLEMQRYLTDAGLAHTFGRMLDQGAFSMEDLTLIDSDKDLIQMGFSPGNEPKDREERKTLLRVCKAAAATHPSPLLRKGEAAAAIATAAALGADGGGGGGGAGGGGGGGSKKKSKKKKSKSKGASTRGTPVAELKTMRCAHCRQQK
jgi:hypothetical protein